jgi:2,3-dihydroxy-p-cumate/2,3-dihydroxybenzoate 3,4-dioxygenase
MIRYRQLSYIALNVTEIGRSRAFYEDELGLRFEGHGPEGEALLRAGPGQLLILHRGKQAGLKRLGWQMESAAQLERVAEALARASSAVEMQSYGRPCMRLVDRRAGAMMDFLAPGHEETAVMSGPIERLGHAVLSTPRYVESLRFLTTILNFHVSDEIKDRITFLRCFPNPLHHSLGIAFAARNMLHHLSFLTRRREDISATAIRLRKHGVPVMCGPGRHAPSGSEFLYFLDPDGLTIECSHGMERFSEAAPRMPRVLPPVMESFDVQANPRDARMHAVGEIEDAAPLALG